MIINLRGTSGSGKSTIVRAVMAKYPTVEKAFLSGRKQPIGYFCTRPDGTSLWVVGHYESPCGGCDTISVPGTIDFIYDVVKSHDDLGHDVLYEGLIVESDVKRLISVAKGDTVSRIPPRPTIVIALTTPVELCLEGIRNRREARGDDRPLNPHNTVERIPQIKSRMSKLIDAGVDARWLSREDALATVMGVLGWQI